jgi:hypothetical protein
MFVAVTLSLVVACAAHAAEDRSAVELWQAYPLSPDPSQAGDTAIGRSRELPVRSMGDASDGAVDSRLMLQLGMLLAVLYAAFLCFWFTAGRETLGEALGRVPALTASVAVRPRTASTAGSPRADANAVWTCAIAWRPGRLRSRFRAMMAPPDGRGWQVVAESRNLRWPPRSARALPTAELVSALESLVAALVAAGWEPVEPAGSWSARRFVWRREGEPPARLKTYWMVTGVPTGIRRASSRMSGLRIRMQPCEMRPGTRSGRSVPWIPTKPPAGQSVAVGERALVPNATGP